MTMTITVAVAISSISIRHTSSPPSPPAADGAGCWIGSWATGMPTAPQMAATISPSRYGERMIERATWFIVTVTVIVAVMVGGEDDQTSDLGVRVWG